MARAEAEAALDTLSDADARIWRDDATGNHKVYRIGLLYGKAMMDGIVADMLSQILTQGGHTIFQGRFDLVASAKPENLDVVFLCHIEPVSTLHLRTEIKAIRRCAVDTPVVLCVWQKADADLSAALQSKVRADNVISSLFEAVAYVARGIDKSA